MRFFEAYLVVFLFCAQILVGSLALLMIHILTGGDWGLELRASFKRILRKTPFLFILFIPIVVGARYLFPWIQESTPASHAYLNFNFFILRSFLYLLLWTLLSWKVQKIIGREESTSADRYVCGWGLVVLGFSATFASIDWMMSREPAWASSMYGLIFIIGAIYLALSYGVLATLRSGKTLPRILRDLGNLLLTVSMLWAYINFMQYLIIWSGNIPDEVTWYLKRNLGGWQWLTIFVFVFSFFLPLACLLFVKIKESASLLGILLVSILLARVLDIIWLVVPASREQMSLSPYDVLPFLALAFFVYFVGFRQDEVKSL